MSTLRIALTVCLLSSVAIGCAKPNAPQAADEPVERPLRCNRAIPEACDVQGMRYENAVGRPRDLNAAARHYAAACDAGYGPGCTHLAGMYFEKEAMDRAQELYGRGCEAGDAEGCANLGFMESRAGNQERSLELYTTACDAGSMAACANLADVHQAGRGVAVDHTRAQTLFDKSCSGGQASSCIRRAWSLARGCEGGDCTKDAEDEAAAAKLAADACAATSQPEVCTAYGAHIESGRYLPKDLAGARAQYQAACDAGSAWGCERLGVALARGLGGPRDAEAAVVAMEKACSADFAAACSGLGAMLLGGEGVPRDEDRGGALVRRACELHEARACNTIALLEL